MAPNDAASRVYEIPPHGTVTYHEGTSDKGEIVPRQSVIPVSSLSQPKGPVLTMELAKWAIVCNLHEQCALFVNIVPYSIEMS
jgi:hypothetical protein